jgi:hypothetical protein
MLNPFHVAFTILGRMLDLMFPRPQARLGAAVAWRSPSSRSEGLESHAAAARGVST